MWEKEEWRGLVFLSFAAYVAGHLVAAISSLVIELFLMRRVIRYPTEWMFDQHPQPRVVVGWSMSLTGVKSALRWLFKWTLPGYYKPYSNEFMKLAIDAYTSRYDAKLVDGRDRFWLAWEYICLWHPVAYRRATHFLELYGFSRNTAMAFFLVMLLPFLPITVWRTPIPLVSWQVVALVAGLLLFVNYAKLFNRMTDEVFRGFVAAYYCGGEKVE